MGLVNILGSLRSKWNAAPVRFGKRRGGRKCRIEQMEPRQLMAADIHMGGVYYEPGNGEDQGAGNTLQFTYSGGAPGTQLTELRVETDKVNDGLTIGDTFFDTAPGGIGSFSSAPLTIQSHVGFTITGSSVTDGGTVLVLQFSGFDPGEKLVLNIDVDEQGFLGPNSVAEGNEFEGSRLKATFAAPHFFDATGTDIYFDAYNTKLTASGLNLPSDNYTPPNSEPSPVLTAGAFFPVQQTPLPITLSGTVYEDLGLDNIKNGADHGIAGVTLTLYAFDGTNYVSTGKTAVTNSQGNYTFTGVLPGTYRIGETQPAGYSSVGATIGTVNGAPDGVVTNVDTLSQITLLGGDDSVHNDFAEALPATLGGFVYHDANNNGNRDAGEAPISEATVNIERIGTGVVATVTTDSNGFWTSGPLIAGNYRVTEVQPSGYLDGLDKAGNAGGTAVNPGDQINGIFLGSGQIGALYLFGELLPSTISGRVHADRNGDCEYQAGEPLLSGVVIHLLDAQGNTLRTTTTNASGEYQFTGLAPGVYGVFEEQPAGYFDSEDHAGTAGGVLVPTDSVTQIHLTSGTSAQHYDFCEHEPASISGFVYVDANNNGVRDAGEAGIAGVKVALQPPGISLTLPPTTTTDANGFYQFTGLIPGVYGVVEVQPAGFFDGLDAAGSAGGAAINPGDSIQGATLTPALRAVNYNFGELPPATIAGRVHADRNGDCNYDSGEPLLAGVEMQLLGPTGAVLQTTFTNTLGEYRFDNLAPGVYAVRQIQPIGYFNDEAHAGTAGGVVGDNLVSNIPIGPGNHATGYDFCETEPASLSGRVFSDHDGDCAEDAGEPGIAGVTIQLLDANNNVVKTTLTNSDGEYRFDNLMPGVYSVRELQPAGYLDSGEDAGSEGGTVSNDLISAINLRPNVAAVDYHFCEVEPSSISGTVHADRDGDCFFDVGEPGIAGVTIQLLNEQGNAIATTLTNAAGEYRFDNLAPGVYGVHELQPAGYFDSEEDVGSEGGIVSANDLMTQIRLGAGVNAIDYHFCELEPASIRGVVHVDTDGNCVDDADGTPLSGVTVQLLGTDGAVLATTTTNAQGQYGFEGLEPGIYAVRELQPAGYYDGADHIGSAGGFLSTNDMISGVALGPNVDGAHYNFCELPGSTISGFVFQDGSAIFVKDSAEQAAIAGNIEQYRDGTFTPDDTPLAGVTLRLADGSGALILDANGNPVIAVTDANGFYQFTNLAPGLYTVLQSQPAGMADGVDTAGSLGGIAVNQSNVNSLSLSLQAIAHTDAIAMISLPAGTTSVNNNFSEVVFRDGTTSIVPPKPDIPVFLPPPAFSFAPPPAILPPVVLVPPPPPQVLYGGSGAEGFTWHLSVVDAGEPRMVNAGGVSEVTFTGNRFDVTLWNGVNMMQSRWVLPQPNVEKTSAGHDILFGMKEGLPIVGDFNGDGIDEIGVFLDGEWFIDSNGNGVWDEGDLYAKLGHKGDQPVVGDWDGDGKADIGIFGKAWPGDPRAIAAEPGLPEQRNKPTGAKKNMPPKPEVATHGKRLMQRSKQGTPRSDVIDHVFHYGSGGDRAVSGDWTGTGVDTIGVFRDGRWTLDTNGNGRFDDEDQNFVYGQSGDIPVVGDFNGDGVDEIGVYRDGKWYVDLNHDHVLTEIDLMTEMGTSRDIPVVGDFSGSGRDEPGLYQGGAGTASPAVP